MPTEAVSPQDAMKSFQSAMIAELPSPKPAKESAAPAAPEQKQAAPAPDQKPSAQPSSTAPAAESREESIPRTAKEWKKFTEKRDADIKERDERIAKAEAKAAELEARVKGGVPAPELDRLKSDLEKIRKERDEYDEKLKLVAVTQHPRFKQEFEARLNSQIELAKKIVPEEQKEAVERILSMPEGKFRDARIEELMENLSPIQTSRFGGILNAVTEINSAKQDIINHSKEEYDKMTAAQKTQADTRAKQMEDALKSSLAEAPNHPLYKKSDDAEWNKDVDSRLQQAESLARANLSVGDSTKIVLDHLALPVVQKQLAAATEEIKSLKAKIADFSGANPSIISRPQGGSVDEGDGVPVKINPGSNPMEAASAWIKSLPRLG